jgi:cysteinyl-tRNA synthetase
MKSIEKKFTEVMEDNLNTPLALKILHQFSKEANKYLEVGKSKKTLVVALKKFKELSDVLGLKFEVAEEKLSEDVEKLIEEREKARKDGDWKKADEIRNELKDMGIVLEDTVEGVRWKKK